MIHDNATPSVADGLPAAVPPKTFDTAIGAVEDLTTALRSAISDVAFAEAARLPGELERALARAATLAQNLPDASERATATHRLGEARAVAVDLFQIAPAPTAAAIAAAEAGDRAAWILEEQAWVARRLARGTNPRLRRPRRARRDTQPASPHALRLAAIEDDAAVVERPVAAQPAVRAPKKDPR